MGLDKIQFDPYLLAKIYDQPIIPGIKNPAKTVQKELPKLKFLGENQKNIALLVQNENEAYLNDELFNLLTNILNACQLGMQDVALVNLKHFPATNLRELQQVLPFQKAIGFGLEPNKLNISDIPNYQVQFIDGVQFVSSEPLTVINENKVLKGKLWQALKQLFNI
ncbi:hypothetical protein COR50_09655 [Chitinophaga caeni]|uniref:Uncharacterized protein n=1 Tax=Chitinophaga caeni TaxID=2029983 RepID=A0A291QU84_9BACT|nr:hypothetical protein [Chitinophaga caeni]ATL47414.1 hypothetical protein COR50_09655 [Chitinophaga caeni]